MKTFWLFFGANLLSICCVGGAIYLAVCGKDGWGWFLLLAAMCACGPKSED